MIVAEYEAADVGVSVLDGVSGLELYFEGIAFVVRVGSDDTKLEAAVWLIETDGVAVAELKEGSGEG